MSKLSVKDVKTKDVGGLSKTISPGNHCLNINAVTLEQHGEHAKKKNAYHLVLHLETDPIEGLEGFFIDPKDESKGRHLGQVGKVKCSDWPFADAKTKSGVVINRDMEIMKMIKTLCVQLGKPEWFDAQDEKHDTIESFVNTFNTEAPFKGVKLNFCIAGREYPRQDNTYMGIDLFLPKFKKGIPFETPGAPKSKLIQYDENEHFVKHEAADVQAFAGDVDAAANEDFTL